MSSALSDAIWGAATDVGEYSGAWPEHTATRLRSSVALCDDCGLEMAPRLALDVVVMVGSVALALRSLGRRRRSGRGDASLLRIPSVSRRSREMVAITSNKYPGIGLDETDNGRTAIEFATMQ